MRFLRYIQHVQPYLEERVMMKLRPHKRGDLWLVRLVRWQAHKAYEATRRFDCSEPCGMPLRYRGFSWCLQRTTYSSEFQRNYIFCSDRVIFSRRFRKKEQRFVDRIHGVRVDTLRHCGPPPSKDTDKKCEAKIIIALLIRNPNKVVTPILVLHSNKVIIRKAQKRITGPYL